MKSYSTYEAAILLGVDESTIRRQCADGRIVGAFQEKVRARSIWRIPATAVPLTREDRRRVLLAKLGMEEKPVRKEG